MSLRPTSWGYGDEKLARQRNDFVGCKVLCRHEGACPGNLGSPFLKKAKNYAGSNLRNVFVEKWTLLHEGVFSDSKFVLTPVLKFSDTNWVFNTSVQF